ESATPTESTPATEERESRTHELSLHVEIGAGLGVAGRSFAPPSSLAGYNSAAIGIYHVEGEVRPIASLALAFGVDKAFAFDSSFGGETAPSSLTRWQARIGYRPSWERLSLEGAA